MDCDRHQEYRNLVFLTIHEKIYFLGSVEMSLEFQNNHWTAKKNRNVIPDFPLLVDVVIA